MGSKNILMVPSKTAFTKLESLVCVCTQTPKHGNALSEWRPKGAHRAEEEEKTTERIEALYLPLV